MAKKTRNTVQLGFFVTIAIILFMVAAYLIGSYESMFSSALRISSVFHNVSGLQAGNNVRYSGINVGIVESLVILDDTTVQVNMKLDKKLQPFIKKDAVASIGSDGLVGSMLVNINPGKGKSTAVENGDIIPSYSRVGTNELLNTLGKTNENIELITNDLLLITKQIIKGKGTIALLLQDSQLADGLRQSVANLQATSNYLSASGRQLENIIAQVDQGDGLLSQLLYDTTVIDNLNTSISQIDTVADQLEPFLLELQQSANDISASSATLRATLEALNAGEGPAGAMLRDTAAANNLRQTLENLNEGTARFSENMEALQHNFLFRRYFKKQAKEKEKAGQEP
ncbi:MAG: MCE family protein [Phaeodactylibacter sp.]|nr:MCE family protein [Phaeodactylibacter sp.]MCB9304543.1 MCE family protein [Lewinellaceae bacterium]